MSSYTKVIILGNCARDVELRYTPSGTAVTDITIATNDRRKGPGGEWIEESCFTDVTLFGRTAEVATEYLRKGSQVLIEGRLKLDQWEDKNGGGKRSKLKVVGDQMRLLGGKGGGSVDGQRGGRQQDDGPGDPQGGQGDAGGPPDDLPF